MKCYTVFSLAILTVTIFKHPRIVFHSLECGAQATITKRRSRLRKLSCQVGLGHSWIELEGLEAFEVRKHSESGDLVINCNVNFDFAEVPTFAVFAVFASTDASNLRLSKDLSLRKNYSNYLTYVNELVFRARREAASS